MRRALRLLSLTVLPASLPMAAAAQSGSDAWLYAPAPTLPAPETPAPERPPAFPSSEATQSAWINQGDWLRERLTQRGLSIGDAVHIRVFKRSRELEIFLRGERGFELYRTYPICDLSGTLGPKRFEGDLQAPEGFYTVRPERLHPNSDHHLAFNLGFPNEFDRRHNRTGSNIMIHGGCASRGCFAMSDYYMEQIYILAEAALRNGQHEIGVEIYPFRMTEANLAAHSGSRWAGFWRSLKPAHDHFMRAGEPATVDIDETGYRIAMPAEREPDPVHAASAP